MSRQSLLVQLNELKEAYDSAELKYKDSLQTQIDELEKQIFTHVEPPSYTPSYKPPRTPVVKKFKDNKKDTDPYVVVGRYKLPRAFSGLPPLKISDRSSKSHLKHRSNPEEVEQDLSKMFVTKPLRRSNSTPEDLAQELSTMTTGKLIKKRRSQKRRRRLNTSKKWKRTMN